MSDRIRLPSLHTLSIQCKTASRAEAPDYDVPRMDDVVDYELVPQEGRDTYTGRRWSGDGLLPVYEEIITITLSNGTQREVRTVSKYTRLNEIQAAYALFQRVEALLEHGFDLRNNFPMPLLRDDIRKLMKIDVAYKHIKALYEESHAVKDDAEKYNAYKLRLPGLAEEVRTHLEYIASLNPTNKRSAEKAFGDQVWKTGMTSLNNGMLSRDIPLFNAKFDKRWAKDDWDGCFYLLWSTLSSAIFRVRLTGYFTSVVPLNWTNHTAPDEQREPESVEKLREQLSNAVVRNSLLCQLAWCTTVTVSAIDHKDWHLRNVPIATPESGAPLVRLAVVDVANCDVHTTKDWGVIGPILVQVAREKTHYIADELYEMMGKRWRDDDNEEDKKFLLKAIQEIAVVVETLGPPVQK